MVLSHSKESLFDISIFKGQILLGRQTMPVKCNVEIEWALK